MVYFGEAIKHIKRDRGGNYQSKEKYRGSWGLICEEMIRLAEGPH